MSDSVSTDISLRWSERHISYIQNQDEHHLKKTFLKEYVGFSCSTYISLLCSDNLSMDTVVLPTYRSAGAKGISAIKNQGEHHLKKHFCRNMSGSLSTDITMGHVIFYRPIVPLEREVFIGAIFKIKNNNIKKTFGEICWVKLHELEFDERYIFKSLLD